MVRKKWAKTEETSVSETKGSEKKVNSVICLNLMCDKWQKSLLAWVVRRSVVTFVRRRNEGPITMTVGRWGNRGGGWKLITPQETWLRREEEDDDDDTQWEAGNYYFSEVKHLIIFLASVVRTSRKGDVENLAGNILNDSVGMARPSFSYTAGGCINWYNLSERQFDNVCKEL